jgi:hypothetical protein
MKDSERLSAVEQYRPLIGKTAHSIWTQMPREARAWISTEDLTEDGLYHIYATWDPSRGSIANYIISTLWRYLHTTYVYANSVQKRSYVVEANERQEKQLVKVEMVSLDAAEAPIEILNRGTVTSRPAKESPVQDCDVKRKFDALYAHASPEMRLYIERWFLYKCAACPHFDECNLTSRLRSCKYDRRSGREYEWAVNEFRRLADKHGVTREDCAYLVTSRFVSTSLIAQARAAHAA